MPACKARVEYWVPKGYSYKMLDYPCGATGIDGYPVQCPKCEAENAHRNWRQEAADAGEAWGEDDY